MFARRFLLLALVPGCVFDRDCFTVERTPVREFNQRAARGTGNQTTREDDNADHWKRCTDEATE